MNYEVIFKEEADIDVFDARQWYESRRMGLGDELLNEIDEYVKVLEQEPQIYQIRKHNWRYCPLKRFPYVIVFEIEEQKVVVFAVFNTYQHPNRLNKRNTEE
jgi:mRNA-degrading endonuclease RelE of RelBE toxin-antitoxin system